MTSSDQTLVGKLSFSQRDCFVLHFLQVTTHPNPCYEAGTVKSLHKFSCVCPLLFALSFEAFGTVNTHPLKEQQIKILAVSDVELLVFCF